MNVDKHLDQIVERLKDTNPLKIILFGSQACSEAQKGSDIDLIVVLNTDDLPTTFKEKMKYQLMVRNAILDINLASRYPGHFGLLADGKPTIKEAETFYKTAKDIFYSVRAELERI